MDQKLFFIILIVFLLTNEFYYIFMNILKYGLYSFFILYLVKIIYPAIFVYIKKTLIYSLNLYQTDDQIENNDTSSYGMIPSSINILSSIMSYIIKYLQSFTMMNSDDSSSS